MKDLFERFEQQSVAVEKILEESIEMVRDRRSPSADLCAEIDTALRDLRSVYDEIMEKLPEKTGEVALPSGASARELETIWEKSTALKRNSLIAVLSEFIKVYSDDARYLDAIQGQLNEAKSLLSQMEENVKASPDVSSYAIFLECVKQDLDENDELAHLIEDEGINGFTFRAISGLQKKKYYIREENSAETTEEQETVEQKKPVETEKTEEEEEPEKVIESEEPKETIEPEKSEKVVESVSDKPKQVEETVEYIHPIHSIRSVKIPSEQKFDELLMKTDRLFMFLNDNLAFFGLTGKADIVKHFSELTSISVDRTLELLKYLEDKGYMCSYDYDGREIISFTPLMQNCINKKSLQNLIKRRFKAKTVRNCTLVGANDFVKSEFVEHLRLVDLHIELIDKLNEFPEALEMLPQTRWDENIRRYKSIWKHESPEDGSIKEVEMIIVSPEEMMGKKSEPGDSMICYSKELPQMKDVAEKTFYMCLTDDALYWTSDGEWKPVVSKEMEEDKEEDPDEVQISEEELTEAAEEKSEEAESELTKEETITSEQKELDEKSEEQPESNRSVEKKEKFSSGKAKIKPTQSAAEEGSESGNHRESVERSIVEQHLEKAKNAFSLGRFDVGNVILKGLSMFDDQYSILAKQYSYATGDPANTDDYRPTNLMECFPEQNGKSVENDLLFMASWLRMFFSEGASYESFLAREKKNIVGNLSTKFAPSLTDAVNALADWTKNQGRGLDQELLESALKHSGMADRLVVLQKKAKELVESGELLRSAHYTNRIKATREALFGRESDLHRQLDNVIQDNRSDLQKVKSDVAEYLTVENGLVTVREKALEDLMDDTWRGTASLAKGKGQADDLTGVERNTLRIKLAYVYKLIGSWILLAGTSKTSSSNGNTTVAALVDRIKPLLKKAIDELDSIDSDYPEEHGSFVVLEYTLKELLKRIDCEFNEEKEQKYYYAQLMKEPFVALDEEYLPYIENRKEQIRPYEFCERAEQYLSSNDKAWEDVIKRIFNVDENRNGADYGIAKLLKDYLNDQHPDVHWPAEFDVDRAIERALDKNSKRSDCVFLWEQNFTARLEMADGDGWFKTTASREKIDKFRNANFEAYYMQENFGFYGRKLNSILEEIRKKAAEQRPFYMQRLDKLKEMLSDEDLSAPVLERIQKLIEADRFGAAESYLQQVERGTLEIRDNGLGDPNSEFNKFIKRCSTLCQNVGLGKKMVDFFHSQHRFVQNKNLRSGEDLLQYWPESSVHPDTISRILGDLGLETERVTGDRVDNHYHAFFPDKGRIENYPHPIADYGSKMFRLGLDIVLIFGAKNSDELFTDINTILQKTGNKPILILCNFAITLQERRKLAKKIATNLRTTAPCLLLDRALVYHLADCAQSERWKIMIQCALPFQPAQLQNPYFENSSVEIPPDMFIGRRDELSSIIDPAGANLIYGGRQLGKTALLQRAKTLQHQPLQKSWSSYVDVKGMEATEAAKAIGKALIQSGFLMQDTKIKDWTSLVENIEFRMMTKGLTDTHLLLLIDEADHLLLTLEASGYKELDQLKRLQGTTEGRFKFVMAGLHNVLRFSQKALAHNSGLPQLQGITVKPLSFADARELLETPLSYLGFMIKPGEEDVIAQILYNTNYFPGLVHFYASRLVKHMQKNMQQASMPPYTLDREVLIRLLTDEDFRQQRVQRLKMTLGIDASEHSYYDALAHVLCYFSLVSEEVMLYGMTAAEIRKECKDISEKSSIAMLDEQTIEALLDELVELNIFRPEMSEGKKRYLFSRASFIEMLGSKDAVESHLIEVLER